MYQESLWEGDRMGRSGKATGAETWEMEADRVTQRVPGRTFLDAGTARTDMLRRERTLFVMGQKECQCGCSACKAARKTVRHSGRQPGARVCWALVCGR